VTVTAVATPTSTPSPVPSVAPTPSPTALPAPSATPPAVGATLEIIQPARPTQAAFAQYALEMRRLAVANGDQAFGAVIVKAERVVGVGPSRVVVSHDATAHAEMEAIRDASRRLGSADLSGCVIYSTSRPCRMCETAAYYARLARMYVGGNATDAGAPGYGAC
jgi:tRNA(Arg) A34 adenosine deaminase TadA